MATVPYKFNSADTVGHGDTYVIHLANPHSDIETEVATILGNGHGCNLQYGRGLWLGEWEPSVTITLQCVAFVLKGFLTIMHGWYPNEQWLHVERHSVDTSYVEMARL